MIAKHTHTHSLSRALSLRRAGFGCRTIILILLQHHFLLLALGKVAARDLGRFRGRRQQPPHRVTRCDHLMTRLFVIYLSYNYHYYHHQHHYHHIITSYR